MKKSEMIDRILEVALRDHYNWQTETDPEMKQFYEGYVNGEFAILHELDLIDRFWDMRTDNDVMREIIL